MLALLGSLGLLGSLTAALVSLAGSTDVMRRDPQSVLSAVTAQADRTPRLLLAFYYPWYGSSDGPGGKAHGGKYIHWEGVDLAKKSIANSTNFPVLGAFDSHDPKVIDQHCAQAKAAGIDALIISWWGKGSFEDEAVKAILDSCATHGIKACLYYEQIEKPGAPDSVAAEFADLVSRYTAHPAYLRVRSSQDDARSPQDHAKKEATPPSDERPVFFIYVRALHQLGIEKWKAAAAMIAKQGGASSAAPLLIADDFGKESLSIFGGAHSYAPMGDLEVAIKKGESAEAWARRVMPAWAKTPREAGKIGCVTIFPGYDDLKIRKPGLKVDRDGSRLYETLWREAIVADPDWILITSFNEWHEGSEIEPSVEHGEVYLTLTKKWSGAFHAPREAVLRAPSSITPTGASQK